MSFVFRRSKRVLRCVLRALPKAAMWTTPVLAIILILVSIHYGTLNSVNIFFTDVIELMSIIFLIAWLVFFAIEILKYSANAYHRYDEDIIGEAFTGIDKKSTVFELALDVFAANKFKHALEMFIEIGNGRFNLSNKEKGVLAFYCGRCYQIMGFYPNALYQYEQAESYNVIPDIMPLFIARCHAETGNTTKAFELYTKYRGSEYKFKSYVDTEIGQMYLRQNKIENALKWYLKAVNKHENYAEALGGAAVAYTILHKFDKGEECYRAALLNHINDSENFTSYYKEIQAAALMESHTAECREQNEQ